MKCTKHGGTLDIRDSLLCDVCVAEGIDVCKCGGQPQYFGEALMNSVSCPKCKEHVMGIAFDARKAWKEGLRGYIQSDYEKEHESI